MAYSPTVWTNNVTAVGPTNLNHLEQGLQAAAVVADAAIAKPASPATSDGLVWSGTAWQSAKLVDANVSATAAILYSKLNLSGGIVNTDINSSAAIAASKLAGYPNDVTKALLGNGTWASFSGATTYRKVTSKTVNTSTTATDLLNGEITIGAGAMGTTGLLRFTAWGDWKQNSGAGASPLRLQLVLGATTLFDTGVSGTNGDSATRASWKVDVSILNLTTGTQWSDFDFTTNATSQSVATGNAFTTGEGYYRSGAEGWMAGRAGITSSVDTTAAQLLKLNVINGSASASYETKLYGAVGRVV